SLVAERELVEARDQNPLTRLPGNVRVAEVCAERLAAPGRGVAFAYFDFDNFKPFNDRYGFRNGDRVIMLFADILRGTLGKPGDFVSHLGGDDFFACVAAATPEEATRPLFDAARRFAREASSFYAPEDHERGWILGKDRGGVERRMSLLTVSVAVAFLHPGGELDPERLSESLAELKREAKGSPDRTALRVVGPEKEPRDGGGKGRDEPPADGEEAAASRRLEERRGPPHPIFTPSLIAAF
ncbi:MAG: GGDEF domain-containing protein, partial [Spirochaetaceae bacterium]|nr:GGDEF domain-containing protein [Spirochaetaceae bacterium]